MIDLNHNLNAVRTAIAGACRRAGRNAGEVDLLAVSKGQPASAVRAMAALGQLAFGENYVQEAVDKIQQLRDAPTPAGAPLQWHFIGRLQSNKAALVAEYFDVWQSVDRSRLVQALAHARRPDQTPLQVLIQVNIDGEAGKGGAEPEKVPALAAEIAQWPTLQLRGLMSIPRPDPDPQVRESAFRQLAALQAQLRQTFPALDWLSIGMSEDFESAIAAGSTMVRVGTALFGPRVARAAMD